MSFIRDDLEGVVYAFRTNGDTVVLAAGDEIPADISLGSHLVAGSTPAVAKNEAPATAENKPQPRRGRVKNSPGGSDAASDDS